MVCEPTNQSSGESKSEVMSAGVTGPSDESNNGPSSSD